MDPTEPPERPEGQSPEPPAETWLPPVVATPRPEREAPTEVTRETARERSTAPPPVEGTGVGPAGRPAPAGPSVPPRIEPRWPTYLMIGSFVVLAVSLAFWWSTRSSSEPGFEPTTLPPASGPALPSATIAPSSAPTSAATGYAFLSTAADGSPYRWNPCVPIDYVVNTAGAPAGALADVQEAARRVSVATGIELRFGGTTAETPEQRQSAGYVVQGSTGPAWAPVLIAWASPDRFQALGYDARASGEGGPYPAPADIAQTGQYVSGMVVLNAGVTPTPADGFAAPTSWGIVLMHELGHVVGLDHVEDPTEIMSSGITQPRTVTDWGAGDRAGLSLLGRSAGCLTEVAPPPG